MSLQFSKAFDKFDQNISISKNHDISIQEFYYLGFCYPCLIKNSIKSISFNVVFEVGTLKFSFLLFTNSLYFLSFEICYLPTVWNIFVK